MRSNGFTTKLNDVTIFLSTKPAVMAGFVLWVRKRACPSLVFKIWGELSVG